jgi:hypothetical protein
MRQRRAEGQRADHDAQGQATAAAEPGGHRLHGRWIDRGEARAGREPQRDRRPGSLDEEQAGVGSGRTQGADRHDPPRGNRSASDSAALTSAPATNPELHGDREHRCGARRQAPDLLELEHDRRRGEPGAQREELRGRQAGERVPAAAGSTSLTDPGQGDRVADRMPLDRHRAVVAFHTDVELRDGLVLPHGGDLDRARDRVAGMDRGEEAQVELEEHAAGPGQVLGHDRVEDRGRHPALDDDASEAGLGRKLLVVVDRVAIARTAR